MSPKGIYERAKLNAGRSMIAEAAILAGVPPTPVVKEEKETLPADLALSKEWKAPPPTSLSGRRLWRLECHTSVPMGMPPMAKAAKALIHKDAPFPAPLSYPVITEMTKVEDGVLVQFESGIEVLVFSSLCYHAVLAK